MKYNLMAIRKVGENSKFDETVEKYKNIIIENGGIIKRISKIGKGILVVPKDEENYGMYFLYIFEGTEKVVNELAKCFKEDDEILDHCFMNAM